MQRLQAIVGASALVALVLTALLPWAPRREGVDFLIVPAALAGAVAPVIGFRLVRWRQQQVRRLADDASRRRAYGSACLSAVGIGAAAALFGVVTAALTDEPLALIGVVTHVLLVGAVWPTTDRLQLFADGGPDG